MIPPKLLLTRIEIETRLEQGLVGRVVTFTDIHDKQVCGKVERLAVNVDSEELMVTIFIYRLKYTVDLQYFIENTTIEYGDTHRGDQRDVRRILKGD